MKLLFTVLSAHQSQEDAISQQKYVEVKNIPLIEEGVFNHAGGDGAYMMTKIMNFSMMEHSLLMQKISA